MKIKKKKLAKPVKAWGFKALHNGQLVGCFVFPSRQEALENHFSGREDVVRVEIREIPQSTGKSREVKK
jgi:hypothetical protein